MKLDLSMQLPQSVKDALDKVWTGVPDNISNIIYTYGDTCYTTGPIPRDLEEHEKIHTKQQGDNPDGWWNRYGDDVEFRYSQELEAYRRQYQYFKAIHGKIKGFKYATLLAKDMSSPVYGNMCTYNQAIMAITNVTTN